MTTSNDLPDNHIKPGDLAGGVDCATLSIANRARLPSCKGPPSGGPCLCRAGQSLCLIATTSKQTPYVHLTNVEKQTWR